MHGEQRNFLSGAKHLEKDICISEARKLPLPMIKMDVSVGIRGECSWENTLFCYLLKKHFRRLCKI